MNQVIETQRVCFIKRLRLSLHSFGMLLQSILLLSLLTSFMAFSACSIFSNNEKKCDTLSQVPLIPRQVLFNNPEKMCVRISPDGQRLACLVLHKGAMNIWVKTIGERNDQPITQSTSSIIQFRPLGAIKWLKRVGDPDTEEDFLKSCSPLFKASNVKIPVFIAQGMNDVRVKQEESDQIVAAMKANGTYYEYLLFSDEGHGFKQSHNRLKLQVFGKKSWWAGGRVRSRGKQISFG